jgi:hypothetical protein
MKLSTEGRKDLSTSEFAIPGSRSYPIHDLNHAKNALARVSQFGSDSEKSRVRAAVHRRYPEMGKAHAVSEGLK